MADAGHDRLVPLDRAHAGSTAHCATILAAASQFSVLPGIDLGLILWTDAEGCRHGAMARSLAALSRATGLRDIPVNMLNLAATVSSYAAVQEGLSPLPPERNIEGNFAAGGPRLVMTRCTSDRLGNVWAEEVFAHRVFSCCHLLPVTSDFDRDVLHLLRAIQDRMDDRGATLTVKPRLTDGGPARWIDAAIQVPDTLQT